jgi:hypothetical protein
MILFPMPIPETTSAEAFERYVGGKCLRASRGKAWRDIKALDRRPTAYRRYVVFHAT